MTIANHMSSIMGRLTVVDGEPSADDRARTAETDRNACRLRALVSNGWERRPLDIARSMDFDEARVAAYLAAMRAIDNSTGGIVVLAGAPGSGKTAAAARWVISRTASAPRFVRAAEFFRSSRFDDRRNEMLSSRALVLDDLGAEYADQHGSYRVDLDELIDRFYADKRVLVITTNIRYASPGARAALKASGAAVDEAEQTFLERYGARVTDRLRECGRWVSSASGSMRRRAP